MYTVIIRINTPGEMHFSKVVASGDSNLLKLASEMPIPHSLGKYF